MERPKGLTDMRSLDAFALDYARVHPVHRIRCDYPINQAPSLAAPSLSDTVPIYHAADGNGYQVSLAELQTIIGGGGGIPQITFNTNLSPLTIYNYGNAVNATGGSAATNTAALTTMFNNMSAAASGSALGGGWAWIPQYNFPVNASTNGLQVLGTGSPAGIIIQGLGGGGKSGSNTAYTFSINDIGSTGVFWQVQGPHSSGGTWIKNIAFLWNGPLFHLDTCININAWNVVLEGCTFTDCPTAVYFNTALAGSMTRCTINYGNGSFTPPGNATGIALDGDQCEISGPSEFNFGNVLGSTTAVGISIGGGVKNCNHTTLRNIHIYNVNYGVDFSDMNGTGIGGGSQNTTIDGCHMECTITCIYMAPASSSGQMFNQVISKCTLTKGQGSTVAGPIVFIDTATGTATNVGPVFLENNVIYSNVTSASVGGSGVAVNNQYGVQIGTCSYVSIIGGQISQCGNQANAGSDGSANVCISGNPSRVTIDNVNLAQTYNGVNSGNSTGTAGAGPTQYGILVSGTVGGILVTGCFNVGAISVTGAVSNFNMDSCSGFTAITVTGTVTTFLITNCLGYNNQNTIVNITANIGTTAHYAANQGSNSGTNYYGPSIVFYVSNAAGSTLKYNGGPTLALPASSLGSFFLNSPYDTFQFSQAPASLQWIGK